MISADLGCVRPSILAKCIGVSALTDIPGDLTTTATISVGGSAAGELEFVGDHDWFAITLTGGQAVTVLVNGIALEDPHLYIRDRNGVLKSAANARGAQGYAVGR